MVDLLLFRRMITPVLIQIAFWLGTLGLVISGLIMLTGALAAFSDLPPEIAMMTAGGSVAAGLATMILGPILLRIYCEILILFFRMNESLTEIRERLPPRSAG